MKKLLLLLLASISLSAGAADFPSGPVKMVLPLPVGSGPDAMARDLAEILSKKWHVPVLIENKPGGAGAVAMNYFVNEPANGLTLYMASNENIVTYPMLYNNDKLQRQMVAVAPFFKNDMILIVSPKIKNFDELKALMKRRPMFGSQSIGSGAHIAGMEFGEAILGNPPVHVPYKEYSAWFVDVHNQEVGYGFATIASTKHLEEAGKLKYLAITTPKRNPAYPNVPTVKELIGKDVTNKGWLVFYTNKDTPKNVQTILARDLRDAIRSPAMQAKIKSVYYEPWDDISLTEFEKEVQKSGIMFRALINKYDVKVN